MTTPQSAIRRTILSLFASAGMLAGCGGGHSGPELATVSGTVTLDGAPLADASVLFMPESGRPSAARTDADGHYTLQYTDEEGATIGTHTVRISTYREADVDTESGLDIPAVPERVPASYNNQTTLREDIVAGHNEVDFALNSEGEIAQPQTDAPPDSDSDL